MPAKPTWISDLDRIVESIRASPRPFVDRATIENLLGVGRRRAQQILAPCVTERIGTSGLVEREHLIARLQQVAQGEEGRWEQQRRQRVAQVLNQLRRERVRQPQLPIEAPVAMINQEFEKLPSGVHLGPGRITVEFNEPQEALEKLLALALAISNDIAQFESRTRPLE